METTVPTLVDRTYRIQARLGEGGMGVVYRARHRLTGRLVAVKLLHSAETPAATVNGWVRARLGLAREFQTLASLHHPNVIEVTDYGFDNDSGPYLAMELLDPALTLTEAGEGETLSGRITLLAHLLRALAYLHGRGVVHRDLKPNNVLCSGGALKVVDFGIAVTPRFKSDHVAGTVNYIAPELLHGASPSVRSDLYAVGVMARRLLSEEWSDRRRSEQPYADQTTKTLTSGDWISGAVPDFLVDRPTSLPDGLAQIVDRLTAPNPSDRYASASDVLYELARATGEALPLETTVIRESFLQTSELIGRAEEMRRLSHALDEVADGRGSSWLLAGVSGVGKSRILSELRTLALVRGVSVTWAQGVAEGGRSFQMWMSALRAMCLRADLPEAEASVLKPLVPELPALTARPVPDAPPLRPGDARSRLFQAIVTLLTGQDRPTLILLEDLHWADVDSLELLAHLSALVSDMPVLLVGSFRSDEARDLPQRLPNAEVLNLRPLEKADCIRLTRSLSDAIGHEPQLAEYLYRQSEGNAFFLIEILRELANQAGRIDRISQAARPEHLMTGGIARVLQHRIERVPHADRELLTLAAMVSREIDFLVLRQLAPTLDLDSWRLTCFNAGILERQSEQWRFAHDKLREAILGAILVDDRAKSHRRVAEAIEAAYPGPTRDARTAVLAYHFERAGEIDKASVYALKAGDIATQQCAYGEAREHYVSALRTAERLTPDTANRRTQIDTLVKLAYTSFVSVSADENFARMTRARGLLDAIGDEAHLDQQDRLRLARIESAIGRIHFYRGDTAEALGHFRLVLRNAEQSGDGELLALPSCLIGTALLAQGRLRQAEPLLAQAVAPLEHLGEPFEWFRAAGYHGASLVGLGRYMEGMAELDFVLARAKQIDQPSILSAAYLMRGTSFLLSGEWPLVIDNLTEVIDLAAQTGDRLHASLAWSGIGWARSHLGSVDAAKECRRKGRDIAQALGGPLMLADWYQAGDAEMALHEGSLDEALRQAQAVASQSREAGRLYSCGTAERVHGAVLAQYGRDTEADDHMRTSIATLEDGGFMLQAAWSRVAWAVALRRRGSGADARLMFDAALRQFETAGCVFALNEARRLERQTD